MKNLKFKGNAFTLAEVLITISIIGVVAAITLPILIGYQNERKYITKLKKVYQNLSSVYELARQEKGDLASYITRPSTMYDELRHREFRDYFMTYYKDAKPDGYYASWKSSATSITHASSNNTFSTFIANDGTGYVFMKNIGNFCDSDLPAYHDRSKKSCGSIMVDLYASTRTSWGDASTKREVGKNVFAFTVLPDKIVPAGYSRLNQDPLSCYTNKFECTQWVLLNNNMDYLHCDDLSWNGKRKCK